MENIYIGIVGLIGGVFLMRILSTHNTDKKQQELEKKSVINDQLVKTKLDTLKVIESENESKIKEIESEKQKELHGTSLVDFFINRNKPKQ